MFNIDTVRESLSRGARHPFYGVLMQIAAGITTVTALIGAILLFHRLPFLLGVSAVLLLSFLVGKIIWIGLEIDE